MEGIPRNQPISNLFVREIHRSERAVAVEGLHREVVSINDVYFTNFNHGTAIRADSP